MQAGFPSQKTLEEFDFKRLKHVEEAYVHQLASCDFYPEPTECLNGW